ncbi:MAG TPA: branched-chain amino acid ABC transporter permease [Beijerinckiaceae bacterium]|jgi:branched-chain amino acid transport system permease protein
MRRLDLNLFVLLLGAAILWVAPAGFGNYGLYVLSLWLVTAVAAMGLNLTLGYAGQVSLAQAAFLGLGAYATALMTAKLGLPWWLAFCASGLLCFAIGIGLGVPALRVQHHYLAFVTLAFATVVYLVARNEQWLTGGVYGLANIPRPAVLGDKLNGNLPFYRFVLAVALGLALVQWWILRSPWGRAFQALRENPLRAASLGVDVRLYTLLAFALGAAYGGFAGALYAPLVEFIDPAPFALSQSLMLLLMVIAGGAGYFLSPFLGALVGVALPEWLRFTGGAYLLFFAGAVMVLLVVSPQGLMGLADRAVQLVRERRRRPEPAAAPQPSEVR